MGVVAGEEFELDSVIGLDEGVVGGVANSSKFELEVELAPGL